MQRKSKPFRLPMTLTHLVTANGVVTAHSLDFDIAATGANDNEALEKLSLAVKTYVEFGLSKDWAEYIMFAAPQEYWDTLTPDTPVQIVPPIHIDSDERKVIAVKPHEAPVAA